MVVQRIDVLVLTALALERRAVRNHLSDLTVVDRAGLAADVGDFTRSSGARLRVAVVETGAGNIAAATVASRSVEAFAPSIVAMVGIAGGLKDVAVCDVVASSKVYWVEGGKQTEVFSARPDTAAVSPSLVQLARAVAASDRWVERSMTLGGGPWRDRNPRSFVAPIVAGEKVVASSDADVVNVIRASYGDALAIDMEDYGALVGASASENVRTIAIRGVSDLLDGKTADDAAGSQPRAAANAAAFLFEMLELVTSDAALTDPDHQSHPARVVISVEALAALGEDLYPDGPNSDSLWVRAGGNPAMLAAADTGRGRWWQAASLLSRGGGGTDISVESLLAEMRHDFPNNPDLTEFLA